MYFLHGRHLIIEYQEKHLFASIQVQLCDSSLFGFGEVEFVDDFERSNDRMGEEGRSSALCDDQHEAVILLFFLEDKRIGGMRWLRKLCFLVI